MRSPPTASTREGLTRPGPWGISHEASAFAERSTSRAKGRGAQDFLFTAFERGLGSGDARLSYVAYADELRRFRLERPRVIALAVQGRRDEARRALHFELAAMEQSLPGTLHALELQMTAAASDVAESNRALGARVSWIVPGLLLLALVVAMGLARVVARTLSRAIADGGESDPELAAQMHLEPAAGARRARTRRSSAETIGICWKACIA